MRVSCMSMTFSSYGRRRWHGLWRVYVVPSPKFSIFPFLGGNWIRTQGPMDWMAISCHSWLLESSSIQNWQTGRVPFFHAQIFSHVQEILGKTGGSIELDHSSFSIDALLVTYSISGPLPYPCKPLQYWPRSLETCDYMFMMTIHNFRKLLLGPVFQWVAFFWPFAINRYRAKQIYIKLFIWATYMASSPWSSIKSTDIE